MTGNELLQYGEVLLTLKEKIKTAQQRAILAVNNELLIVYWEIGSAIARQEQQVGWGGKTVDKLASDLKAEFPEMKGLSPRNLRYMRDFAVAYPVFLQQAAANSQQPDNENSTILQQLAAKLPWGHHQVLLTKLKNVEERAFYIQKAVENGWSRSILEHHIESGLHKTQGALINNFGSTLSAYQSELTQQVFKDPYNFDFIMLSQQAKERDLEDALMNHVTKVMLELGAGFAFMGRQKRFEAGGREFFVDLLFYHTKLRRHVIIELKIGEFEPEYVSKMNLYLGLADDQLRGEYDEPAIGLILCKTNNKIVAEYALRDTAKPIGIAAYKIAEKLPEDIKGELPSIEEFEQELQKELDEHKTPTRKKLEALKEKIATLQKEEVKTPATPELLLSIHNQSLKPLFITLIEKLDELKDAFLSTSYYFSGPNNLTSMEAMDKYWSSEQFLNQYSEQYFQYSFSGFKKGGIDSFSVSVMFYYVRSTYWYGFKLINQKEEIIRKMYTQQLSNEDINLICDTVMEKLIDQIEEGIARLETNKE
jgi:predicted nuclease of restriction endonuclease-like (RecB) superfamily